MANLKSKTLDSVTLNTAPDLPKLFTGSGASVNDDDKAKILQVVLRFKTVEVEAVEEALSHFTLLNGLEKESARGPVIEKILGLAFGENAVTKGSANFEVIRTTVWSTDCYLSPRVIVMPTTSYEISQILSICRFLRVKFSVRGGGHLQNPGFCSNDGGVVISMSKFDQVILSEDKSTCDVGLGLRWIEVYKALDEYELAVTGGRVASVGVPGLLLGGGLSYQHGDYGFCCNTVVDYEIVLADGGIVNANAKENTDLFWALKGGCANFGVVTKVQMTTVPNIVWSDAKVYSMEQNHELMKAVMSFHESSERDLKGTIILYAMGRSVVLVCVYNAPTVVYPEVFKCFQDIPFTQHILPSSCRTIHDTIRALTALGSSDPGLVHEMRTMSSLPDQEMYELATHLNQKATEELKDVKDLKLILALQPISSGAIRACDAKGSIPLGLKAEPHEWLLILADFRDPADSPLIHSTLVTIFDQLEAVARKNNTYLPFQYANYAGFDQNPLTSYGVENLAKLKDIAAKYDPEGIFQTLQNGGWLVSRA